MKVRFRVGTSVFAALHSTDDRPLSCRNRAASHHRAVPVSGATSIAQALEFTTALKELSLRGNQIGAEGAFPRLHARVRMGSTFRSPTLPSQTRRVSSSCCARFRCNIDRASATMHYGAEDFGHQV